MDLILRAQQLAEERHGAIGQVRKYTFEPYIVHPAEVAEWAARLGLSPEAVAASWCHDLYEDTDTSLEAIAAATSPRVADLVFQVSHVSRPGDGNRAHRKMLDLRHYASGEPEAQAIKCIDGHCNLISIVAHDPAFGFTYWQEKFSLWRALTLALPDARDLLGETLHRTRLQLVQAGQPLPDEGYGR